MVVWINGAYGSGKSTVAEELRKMIDDSFIYDPESAGNFIRNNIPDGLWKDDFQDYPLWREINYKMIMQLTCDYPKTIIVPMTIIKINSFKELIVKLINSSIDVRHFILHANENTLLQRLLGRGEKPDSWCVNHIDHCIAAFQNQITGITINTEQNDAFCVAKEIKERLN